MRFSPGSRGRPAAASLTAITLAAALWLEASAAFAGSAQPSRHTPPLPQPNAVLDPQTKQQSHKSRQRRTTSKNTARTTPMAQPRQFLGQADEVATLHAIHVALTSVGDGGAFVWQRGNGRLRGLIRPTTSFKSTRGKICRHIVIRLYTGSYSREVEGIACKAPEGGWSLSG